MFKEIIQSVSTTAFAFLGFLASYLNQLPEKAREVKTRIYQAPPWANQRTPQERNHINKQVNEHAQSSPNTDARLFNHPRR